jgi:hypothetical protein
MYFSKISLLAFTAIAQNALNAQVDAVKTYYTQQVPILSPTDQFSVAYAALTSSSLSASIAAAAMSNSNNTVILAASAGAAVGIGAAAGAIIYYRRKRIAEAGGNDSAIAEPNLSSIYEVREEDNPIYGHEL